MHAVTVVTGAASGIGAACVELLLKQGTHVLAVDMAPIVITHPKLTHMHCDVTTSTAPQQICAAVAHHQARIEGFVHAAGINRLCHPFEVDGDHWDAVMNVNAKATWFLTSAILQHMMLNGSGSVVLLASIAGKMASTIQHPIYNVSKAAVIAMTKTFAHTVATAGIRINCVCPGVIETPMQHQVTMSMVNASQSYADVTQQRTAKVPMGRMGSAAEVAEVILFLLSEQARYVHGQSLNIDGGLISY